MSLPQLKRSGYTVEDWKAWEGRWELINGVAYDMTPAPSYEHQLVSGALFAAIWNALGDAKRKGGGECDVLAAPLDVFLASGVYQPDLVVVCDPDKKNPRGIEGAPDLIVEILSPSTSSKDTVVKRWAYAATGVPEYLIVDPLEKFATHLHLEGGHYRDSAPIAWGTVVALLGGRLPVVLGDNQPAS